ncbi:hypothetical protein [Microbacterium aurantiacum]|uniref:Asp23/Gls24 family envelope stress response protein n=1 Tax=Microbacterium aurantiacum TaxID=162393 RepID=A0AAJ2LXC2_9MICO|nr:hypothetical protein [Microbacterium aurantiacum]MDS0244228.1 hypothetical protein [Microbacterium aurantiacum]
MSGAAPGRIVVRDRVTQKVTEAVAASIIGVDRDQVSATVSGSRGALGVQLRSPFPVPPLDDTAAIAAAGPVLDRAADVQTDVAHRLAEILGRNVVRVDVTITGAVTPIRRRVR